jgi:hypothetical protein
MSISPWSAWRRIWPPPVMRGHAARRAAQEARVRAAEEERHAARERLVRIRHDVDQILAAGRRNRFAEIIGNGLREGNEKDGR